MYTVTEYCIDPDCRCLHRSGVITYEGDDADRAKEAEKNALYGYVEVTYSPPEMP